MTTDKSDPSALDLTPPPVGDGRRTAPEATHELPAEVLNQLPAQVRERFEMFAAMGPVKSGPDRLLERIPEDQAAEVVGRIVAHADKELDLQHAKDLASINARERQQTATLGSEERRQVRALWFAVFVIVLGVLLAGYCLVADKDQLAVTLLSSLLSAAGGFGLGRGTKPK